MTTAELSEETLDYDLCNYGASRIMFRGPKRETDQPYFAFLGGTETYGKFVPHPYVDRLETTLGRPCVNLGYPNAGLDMFLNDTGLLPVIEGADAVVIQVLGASNLSNKYYRVHPRRNDRFLRATPMLISLFPEIDFTEFHFTRHLLTKLHMVSPKRFAKVVDALQRAWLDAMTRLLARMNGPVYLLWFSDRAPESTLLDPWASEPLFINDIMLRMLDQQVDAIIEVTPDARTKATDHQGLIYPPSAAETVRDVMGIKSHEQAAKVLAPVLVEAL